MLCLQASQLAKEMLCLESIKLTNLMVIRLAYRREEEGRTYWTLFFFFFFFFFFFINDRGWEQTYEVDPWQIGLPSSFLQPPPPETL